MTTPDDPNQEHWAPPPIAPPPSAPPPVVSPLQWSPPPIQSVRPRRRRGLLAAGALAAVGAVVTGGLAWSQWADSHSPATVVKGFYRAIAAGDAPTALAFAETTPTGEYLTSAVLQPQLRLAKL